MKTIKFIINFLVIGMLLATTACSDDVDNTMPPPTSEDAVFSYSFDPENPNKVFLIADPQVPTWYTHWNFGDNSSAEELEASKVYLKKGDYDVEFKIFTVSGTASSVQTIVINEDFEGPNILLNGEFNGSDHWTVLPISDGVDVNFTDDKAIWTGGGWGQVGIYQAVHLEANVPYQIDMEISGSGMSDSWYEVYIGMETPVPGQDYADGGIRLGLNTWNGCGSEPFDGLFTEISCVGEGGGLVQVNTSGTYYLVIRGGGADYGADGVSIDNASIRPLETGIVITPPVVTPVAKFSAEITNLESIFTNESTGATSFTWDFGDSTGTSTEENPTYTYAEPGTYSVKLTATNDQGSDEITQEVTVQNVVIADYIQNPGFDDTSVWTIIQQNDAANGKVTIANGVATFDEITDAASGSWGSEAHVAMYQGVNIAAGDYQFDMDITTNGIDEVWFEVYLGTTKPEEGVEYNFDNSGATKILSFNAWDCGDTNKTYAGKMAAVSCQDTDGSISLEADTYYFVIRTGGFTFGEGGIVIDNITMEEKVISTTPVANFDSATTNLAATFTNTSTNATSYTWDFGDGSGTSTEENPTYTYASAGTYSVILTATNDDGSADITKDVTVTAPVTMPTAAFTYNASDLDVTFTNSSSNAISYAWDFGDGNTSTEENPTNTYTTEGTYTVKLTATNTDGSSEETQDITVTVATATNLVTNGTFDDESGWTVVNHYEATNTLGSVTIADGVAKFEETASGDWKHMGIYTAVTLEAGTYQYEMDMAYTDISDLWGEVYIGASEPVDGSDYGTDQGASLVLKAYNAWDCDTIKTYSGKASTSGCDTNANPGQFEITEAGTYYLLFRSGGATYGTDGIVIDNVSLTKVN